MMLFILRLVGLTQRGVILNTLLLKFMEKQFIHNGTDMKQTVEEAAKENILFNHRTVDRTLFGKDLAKFGEMNFVQGAEWQSKQSPWISVKERLPEPNKLVLCRMVSNGAIVSGYIVVSPGRSPYVATDGGFEFEDWNDYECDMWMPIPSFDDILEANKDVLERIKEKGD